MLAIIISRHFSNYNFQKPFWLKWGSKFSQPSQPFHLSTFANSHYSIPMAEATRPEKRMRKQTLLLDIATALGVPAEEARARMQTGGVEDFDDLENDDDATPGARDRAMVITDLLGRMEEAETRITEGQARLAVHDRQIKQLSNDVYKNIIRVAPARKTTVKQFHEAFDKIENELKQITAPKITNVKRDGLYIDLVMESLKKPKPVLDKIRAVTDSTHAIMTVPPPSVDTNIYVAVTKAAYRAYMHVLTETRDDMDATLPREYQPTTRKPVLDAVSPCFSLEHDGVVFLSGVFERTQARIRLKARTNIKIKEVAFLGEKLLQQLRIFYVGPFALESAYSAEELVRAPRFEEVRREDRIRM